ncbi:MAG: hypothetical protein R3E61_00055 [Pseudomonadales bacterium]
MLLFSLRFFPKAAVCNIDGNAFVFKRSDETAQLLTKHFRAGQKQFSDAALLKHFTETTFLQNLRGEITAQLATKFLLKTKDKFFDA